MVDAGIVKQIISRNIREGMELTKESTAAPTPIYLSHLILPFGILAGKVIELILALSQLLSVLYVLALNWLK